MTLAKFVHECMEMGAKRPPVDQILQFKYVQFGSVRAAEAAKELLNEQFDADAKFNILDNQNHAMLQIINPTQN